jgi:hypothetical protein
MVVVTIKRVKTIIESNGEWYLHYFEKPPLRFKHGKLDQKVHLFKILF